MARLINDCRVPAETKLPGLREMEKRDVKAVARLLRAYLARMDMAPLLKNKEVEHALLGGRGKDVNGKRVGQVVSAYVVEVIDLFHSFILSRSPLTRYSLFRSTGSCHSRDNGHGLVLLPPFDRRQSQYSDRDQRRVSFLLRHHVMSVLC